LLVEMYNLQGELLADMQLSEEMLESGYIVRAGESLLHAGEIGGEMKEKMMGDKMPNTASPYAAYMLFGAMLVWLGWAVLRRSREGTAE
jgi:processed acidic surface protein